MVCATGYAVPENGQIQRQGMIPAGMSLARESFGKCHSPTSAKLGSVLRDIKLNPSQFTGAAAHASVRACQ